MAVIAQAVLRSLGDDGPTWVVEGTYWDNGRTPSDDADLKLVSTYSDPGGHRGEDPTIVVVRLVSADNPDSETVTLYFSPTIGEAEATAAFADQLQDEASESAKAWGRPLPPCPNHSHPLRAQVENGIAVWQCPRGADHYNVPIVVE